MHYGVLDGLCGCVFVELYLSVKSHHLDGTSSWCCVFVGFLYLDFNVVDRLLAGVNPRSVIS